MNKLLTILLLAAIGLAMMATNTPVTPAVSSTPVSAAPSAMTTHGAASTNDADWKAAFDKLQSDHRDLESRYTALEHKTSPVLHAPPAQACRGPGCVPAAYSQPQSFNRRPILRWRR